MRDALEVSPRKGTGASRLAIWTAGIGLALILLSGLAPRIGLLSPLTSFGIYGGGSLLLFVALFAASIGLTRSGGTAGLAPAGATWLALVAAVALTAWNGLVLASSGDAPPINDISTDTDAPPEFVDVVPLRGDAPSEYLGAEAAQMQRSAYPDIRPFLVSAPRDEVFDAAVEVVKDEGWELVAADDAAGRIEATARTGWVRFEDDVVIRVRAEGERTRVDVRSKSRMGRGDMGVNAKRIRGYLDALRGRLAG